MTRISINDLCVEYKTSGQQIRAVDRVSFDIEEDEVFGIVGESGCGKSTLAKSLLRLLDENGTITDGNIVFEGEDITKYTEKELSERIRGKKISMVFQDPDSSLDPVYTIGEQIIETLIEHLDISRSEARERAIELLDEVGIPSAEERLDSYPSDFSGGMKQRVVLAIAISCNPDLLIADEPTTALDVTIQAQILRLFDDIRQNYNTSIMIITHDLGVISQICDRIGVMYAGNLVEVGTTKQIYENPKHPYTQALYRSIPTEQNVENELPTISGFPPDLSSPPDGCRFHPRCDQVCGEACESGPIPPTYLENGQRVRCYLYDSSVNSDYTGETEKLNNE